MCGIAGILNLDGRPVAAEHVQSMCDAISHRGPDDQGFYVRGEAGLGMRRLSIIDVDGGQQPISNEDGSIWVVFNGEIYNFQSLANGLIERGHKLRTHSDTEVIVHLYEEFGADLVKQLRGMFAFALWDSNEKRVLIARDRLGIKPLYYAHIGNRFLFASELKSILQVPGVDRTLDTGAVNSLFTTLTTPNTQSIVRDIRKLEPAHILTVGARQGLRVTKYWEVSFAPNRRASDAELIDGLRAKIDESVRMHMISDVPVGAFLSGGIDSSSVVAHMARHSDRTIKTFAVGFRETAFNELPYARTIAKKFATDHYEHILEPDIHGFIDDLVWHLDEPFGDPSAIPTFVLSRMAAQQVKVVQSGDGGDELFAGYDKYRVEQQERRVRLPRIVRKALGVIGSQMREGAKGRNLMLHRSLSGWDRYFDAGAFFREDARRALLHADVFAEVQNASVDDGTHWLSAAQKLDLQQYLPNDVLTKVDRMSMAHSLEVRVPLLDHEVVEFAATIPPELNLNADGGKAMFKRAMRGILPDDVIDRPKRGFAVPLSSWFRGELEGFARDVLLDRRAKERNILNTSYVERLLDLHRAGRPLDFQLWTLISFELWCRMFLDARQQQHTAVAMGASA